MQTTALYVPYFPDVPYFWMASLFSAPLIDFHCFSFLVIPSFVLVAGNLTQTKPTQHMRFAMGYILYDHMPFFNVTFHIFSLVKLPINTATTPIQLA